MVNSLPLYVCRTGIPITNLAWRNQLTYTRKVRVLLALIALHQPLNQASHNLN